MDVFGINMKIVEKVWCLKQEKIFGMPSSCEIKNEILKMYAH